MREVYALTPICEGLWTATHPQRFYGVEVGARMSVLELGQGLLVHSPIAGAPDVLRSLGRVRWVVAPNLLHHLYLPAWQSEPGVEIYGAPGLPEKRADLNFTAVIDVESEPFGDDVLAIPLRSFDVTREVVLFHRSSRTLIVTDLIFNFSRSAPIMTRLVLRALGGFPGPKTTLLERRGMKKDIARAELQRLLALDFDRLIMAHGEIIETAGKKALKSAFEWLG
ncbi:MAG: DUF4336 domain-containing protein [Myxococcota bacterium]